MHRLTFILMILLCISCEVELTPPNSDSNDSGDREARDRDENRSVRINAEEREVFQLINDYRASKGLNRLKWLDRAIIEAQYHSVEMAKNERLTHNGLGNRIESIRVNENVQINASGENVGYNQSARAMVNGWKSSYGHHKNILGNYTHTGIGEAKGSDGNLYYTQIFIRLQSE